MLKILNVHMEGFCSIVEPQTLNLDLGGTILIKAPNGFGKSTLFSAITWGLYGKNPKGKVSATTWKKYQPADYKGTKVIVTWVSDKSIFRVTRCQKYTGKLDDGSKGGDRVILVKDGEPLKVKGKVNIQQAINKALGFSYELFVSSIMFGQGMKRLIQEDNSDKKKIFEEIFNLEYLTTARSIAQEERNALYEEYREVEHQTSSFEKEITILQKTYKELKEKEDTFNEVNLKNIQKYKQSFKKLQNELKALKAKVSQEDYGETYQKLKKDIQDLQDSIQEAEQLYDIPLIEVVESTIKLLESREVNKALKTLKKVHTAFQQVISLQGQLEKTREALEEVRAKYREQEKLEDEVEDIRNRIKYFKDLIEELKSSKVKETSPKYLKKIAKIKSKLSSLKSVKSSLEEKLDDYSWVLSDPLSNNGIKAFLFDSSLQALNDNLERYAEVLGFRISFEVDLDSARKDFVTLIEKDGAISDYDELSGGEKGLVNLTMCLALHETLTLSKDVNLLLLDEVFENLDRDNIELVISLIRTLSEGKTVFLISHIENLPFGNCKTLEVSKNNGQTHYSHL